MNKRKILYEDGKANVGERSSETQANPKLDIKYCLRTLIYALKVVNGNGWPTV